MITLKSFGTVDLHGDENRPLQTILAQPKRLALLVYLAVAAPRGYHRRDQLLGLLWPELDETRARKALNRALHFVRSAIGEDVVPSRGPEELGLDWTRIWSDVAGFEEALDRGELAEALALYRGPLMPGFFVDEAPAYDHWLQSERDRLQQRAIQAAGQLSEKELKAGRLVPAIEWARRATTLAPQDETVLRRLMSLLEQAGDRAGAVRIYEEFARELSREYDVDPSSETRALCDAIRARETAAPAAGAMMQTVAAAGTTVVIMPQPSAPPAPARPLSSAYSRVALSALGLIAAVAVLWAGQRFSATRAANAARKTPVAIMRFSTSGPLATRAMADSVRDDVTRRLDSLPTLRVVSTETRARGGYVVVGTITSVGRRFTIDAQIKDSAKSAAHISAASVEGVVGETRRMARDLGTQLVELAAHGKTGISEGTTGKGGARVAAALDAMNRGDSLYATGRFSEAAQQYRHAAEIDTSYGPAYLGLSRAANWENQWDVELWASNAAVKHLSSFTPLDQIRVRAWDAYVSGRPSDAERLSRMVLANRPGDGDGWYELGEVEFHWGPLFGWSRTDSRHAFEMLDTLGFGSTWVAMLVHLARIAAVERDTARVDSLVAVAMTAHPDAPQTLELRALRAFAGTSRNDQDAVLAQIAKSTDTDAQNLATFIAVCGIYDERSARAIELLSAPARAPNLRGLAAILRDGFEIAHGRWDGGARLAATPNIPRERVLERRAIFASLPFVTLPRDTLLVLRASLSDAPTDARAFLSLYNMSTPLLPMRRQYLLGLLSVRLGDLDAATRYSDTLDTPPFQSDGERRNRATLSRIIRAKVLRARGKSREALAALGEPDYPTDGMLPGLMAYPAADERFLHAELLHDLHRDDEALRWYDTFPDPGGYDLPYVAPALYRQAEIAKDRGEVARADGFRTRANALWGGAGAAFTRF